MLISDTVLPTGMPNFRICAFITRPRLLCAWPLGAIFSALRVSINEQWSYKSTNYNLFIIYFGASSGILKSAKALWICAVVAGFNTGTGTTEGVGGEVKARTVWDWGLQLGFCDSDSADFFFSSFFFGDRGVAGCEETGSRGFQTPASALRTGLSDSVVAAGTSSCFFGDIENSPVRGDYHLFPICLAAGSRDGGPGAGAAGSTAATGEPRRE